MIRVRDLVVEHRGDRILEDLSFSVPERSIFAILGPEGSGARACLAVLATMAKPTGGSVRIDGHDVVSDRRKLRTLLAHVPENPRVEAWRTGADYLHFWAMASGLPLEAQDGRIRDLAAFLALEGRLKDPMETHILSVRRRLGLAQALLTEPQLLLLDHPLAGLDEAERRASQRTLAALRDQGKTLVLTSSELVEVQGLCDRVILLQEGRSLGEYSFGDLLDRIGEQRQARVFVESEGLPSNAVATLKELQGVLDVRSTETVTVIYVRPGAVTPDEIRSTLDTEGVKTGKVTPAEIRLSDVYNALRRER